MSRCHCVRVNHMKRIEVALLLSILYGQPPSKKEVEVAFKEAGFDFVHNVLTQAAHVGTNHSGVEGWKK